MKKYHYFIADFPEGSSRYELVDRELVHRITHVLKLRVGEKIMLSNGKGKEALASITFIDEKKVVLELGEPTINPHELKHALRVCCAIVKREVFETVVRQATELGVREIIPIISERTIKTQLNTKRLKKIIEEAAEQSERGYVPDLLFPIEFRKSILDTNSDTTIVFDRSGVSPQEILIKQFKKARIISVYIGPEGGWSKNELDFVHEQHIPVVSFGESILRTDTAVVASLLYTRLLLN